MSALRDLAAAVGGLLFSLVEVGFIPCLVSYLAEKAGLKNGTPPTRCWIFVAIAALMVLSSVVWTILDPEDGAFTMIFAFLGAAVMLGVVLGIKAAQSDFRRQNKSR